jgi:hypothetical protein
MEKKDNIKKKFLYLPGSLITTSMNKTGFIYRVFDLYYDGFKHMRLGKTLWLIILIKLFIIFVILKIFFFPDFLKLKAQKGGEADYVSSEVIKRSIK